jgi:hypothetical protein
LRDYYQYFVTYETYDPNVFPDTPQWNAFNTAAEADPTNNGMSPIFGGQMMVANLRFRVSPKDEFVAMVNATRSAGLFANAFNPGKTGGNGFWYFNSDSESLRALGENSLEEKKAKAGKAGKIKVSFAQYLFLLYLTEQQERRYLAASRTLNILRAYNAGKLTEAQALDQATRNDTLPV